MAGIYCGMFACYQHLIAPAHSFSHRLELLYVDVVFFIVITKNESTLQMYYQPVLGIRCVEGFLNCDNNLQVFLKIFKIIFQSRDKIYYNIMHNIC